MATRTAAKAFRYLGNVFSKGEQVVMDAAHEAEFEAKGFIAKMVKPKDEPKAEPPVEPKVEKAQTYKTRDMRAGGAEIPESRPAGAVAFQTDGFVLSEKIPKE